MAEPMNPFPNMNLYYLGLLHRGPAWTAEETPEVAQLNEGHLANIRRLEGLGKLVLAGPFLDDSELQGIYIFRATSLEEAKALVETDPAVQAGRLVFELHPWIVKRGTVL
jgi:uncharacterized protein